MQNIDMQREGDQLVIRVDLSKNLGRSRSGKTTIIATTSLSLAYRATPSAHEASARRSACCTESTVT